MIAIVDYNAGNVRSVLNAMNKLGVHAEVTSDKTLLENADKVIFPGVGHAQPAMKYLREKELDKVIISLKQPFLGICLGMQLMCSYSEEGNTECLSIFTEKVKRFPQGEKIPHMGWNTCQKSRGDLFKGIGDNFDFYFVHSYYAEMGPDTSASCQYGIEFTAVLQKRNFFGVQFHPEKSGEVGSKLLKNFLSI